MSTTSACSPARHGHRLVAVGRLADHLEVGLGVDDHGEPAAHQLLVVGDDDADGPGVCHDGNGRRASTAKPPPGAGPASSAPPSTATRSRIPTRPCPPPSGTAARWPRAPAVVDDAYDESVGLEGQVDAGPTGVGVAQHVGERLLHDPVGGHAHEPVDRTGRTGRSAARPPRRRRAPTPPGRRPRRGRVAGPGRTRTAAAPASGAARRARPGPCPPPWPWRPRPARGARPAPPGQPRPGPR